MKAKSKAKKKEAKSQHWPMRIKTPVANKVLEDVKEGLFENKAEAINNILAGHYKIKLPSE